MLGALLLGVAVAGAPALSYAQHSGGGSGGHGGGGGGGHSSGGGGHFSGGGHAGGGGGHFSGGGYAGGHYMSHGGYAGGYAAGGHYSSGAHGYAAAHYGAGYTAGRVSAPVSVHGGFRGYGGRGFYPGRSWGGGYWHGVFWPRCWYYPGFAWFLPVLPLGYATFWWGGSPYYYWDNLYYTWSPADNGYVVTTPPPVAGDEPDQSGNAGAVGAPADSAADVFLYPRNGQSDQQMANDRYECHSWAVGQTGFDPTHGGPQSGNRDDYRRAMISCLDARGYSAR
jgi:hypothetical protein